jgi:hypothetical protein
MVGQMAAYAAQRNTHSISEDVGLCAGAGKFETFTVGSNIQNCGKC